MAKLEEEFFYEYFGDSERPLEISYIIKDLNQIVDENPVYNYKKRLENLKLSPEEIDSIYSFLCFKKFHIEIAKHQIKFQTLRLILNGIDFSKIKIEVLFACLIKPCSLNILCKILKVLSRCPELKPIKEEMEGFIIILITAYLNTEIQDHNEKFTTLRLLSSCKNDSLILDQVCKLFESKFEMTATENRILSNTKKANYISSEFYPIPKQFQEKKSLPIESLDQFQLGELIHIKNKKNKKLQIRKIIQDKVPKNLVAKITTSNNLEKINQEEADILVEMKYTKNIVEVFGVILKEEEEKVQFKLYIILEEAPLTLAENIKEWSSEDDIYRKNHQDEREREALNLLKQIVEAIMNLRSKNIWHRDIKPDNILVFYEGQEIVYKLADFDVSRKHKRYAHGDTVETRLIKIGTGSYFAPELISGPPYLDKFNVKSLNYNKSDVYSLGITIYEFLLTLSDGNINSYLNELQTIIYNRLNEKINDETLKEYMKEMLCVDCNARISFSNLYKLMQETEVTFTED